MAEDDIAFLLNRWELVEPHEIKQNSYCTSANIKIFFLVQYSNDIWKNHILTVLITLLKKKYLWLYNKRVIAWILVNIVPRSVSYCTRTIWYTARDNIHQYSCNNPIIVHDVSLLPRICKSNDKSNSWFSWFKVKCHW
jgi:hypothetical protein